MGLVTPWVPAMKFGVGTSHRVSFGSASDIDDLTAMTVVALVKSYTSITSRALVSKGSTTAGWSLRVATGVVSYVRVNGTTNLSYPAASATLPTTTPFWTWVAASYDPGRSAGDLVRLYSARHPTTPAPIALTVDSLGTTADGSGAYTSDASSNLTIGAYGSAIGSPGVAMALAAVFSSALTKAEIEEFIANPLRYAYQTKLLVIPGLYGSAVVPDWSPAARASTVSGPPPGANGPSWAPWMAHQDADLATVAGGGGGGGGVSLVGLYDPITSLVDAGLAI